MTDNHPDRETDTRPAHGWGWLQHTEPAVLHSIPSDDSGQRAAGSANEWQWIAHPPAAVDTSTAPPRRARMPRKASIGLATALGIAGVLVVAGIVSIADRDYTAALISTETVNPPTAATSTSAAVAGACAGLSGQTVTAGGGDAGSAAGVIAAFEHAYYVQRNPEVALRLVAPEVGIVPEALAAGIASIPAGTTHCVAITPIAAGAAEVHLVELHPNGQRIDYLQLINLARYPGGGVMVITNIQKRG
ncbi:hypothetical protein ABZ540_33550 [Nocardia xishanensis]|uniref:hypothetical protein n=1 Tax=Nocardia xishanensis TaxID=238964 RepID=UPI0033C2A643